MKPGEATHTSTGPAEEQILILALDVDQSRNIFGWEKEKGSLIYPEYGKRDREAETSGRGIGLTSIVQVSEQKLTS